MASRTSRGDRRLLRSVDDLSQPQTRPPSGIHRDVHQRSNCTKSNIISPNRTNGRPQAPVYWDVCGWNCEHDGPNNCQAVFTLSKNLQGLSQSNHRTNTVGKKHYRRNCRSNLFLGENGLDSSQRQQQHSNPKRMQYTTQGQSRDIRMVLDETHSKPSAKPRPDTATAKLQYRYRWNFDEGDPIMQHVGSKAKLKKQLSNVASTAKPSTKASQYTSFLRAVVHKAFPCRSKLRRVGASTNITYGVTVRKPRSTLPIERTISPEFSDAQLYHPC